MSSSPPQHEPQVDLEARIITTVEMPSEDMLPTQTALVPIASLSQNGASNKVLGNSGGGSKRQRKVVRKQQVETNLNGKPDLYKDIEGVSDWFQIKRAELEAQQDEGNLQTKKSLLAGLPLSTHSWKPPRIDPERYQQELLPPTALSQALMVVTPMVVSKLEQQFPVIREATGKRKHRSYSSDRIIDQKVRYRGDTLIADIISHNEPLIPSNAHMEMKFDVSMITDKLNDYLELSDFISRETLSSCSGLWLKGSLVGYQERALQLLHSYNYNYDLAKFHILFPGVMGQPDRKQEIMNSLSEKELESIVADAVIDLRGCKTQEAEEAIASIRSAVTNRITVDDLNYYQQVLKKLRVETPDDVETEIYRSREFSKLIKKKCGSQAGVQPSGNSNDNGKKMKMGELLQMQQDSIDSYFIVTPEMVTLFEYVQKARQWQERAEQAQSQTMVLKSLQTLLQEARLIPVNFEELYETIRKRAADGQALVDKIYNTFTKVTKTRTQVSSSLQSSPELVVAKKIQEDKKETQYRQLLKEADSLMIIHQEVNKLREHMDSVDQWKARVRLFLEDEREQKAHKEVFTQLIRETVLFKIELDLTEDLQRRLEFIEWHAKVLSFDSRTLLKECDDLVMADSVLQEEEEVKGDDFMVQETLVDFSKLQQLMQEGQTKGFLEVDLHEIQRMRQLCTDAEQKQEEIQKVINDISESNENYRLSHLTKLLDEITVLRVSIEEIQELEELIQRAKQHEERCKIYLEQCAKLNSEDKQQVFLNEVLMFKAELSELNILSGVIVKFNIMIRPLLIWIQYSRQIIKSYYKSLDLQQAFTHLNLLEQQQYDDDDLLSDSEEVEPTPIPDQDYQLLGYLINEANQNYKVLLQTRDYQLLSSISDLVQAWIQRADDLEANSDAMTQSALVEQLEKLTNENLPTPSERHQALVKKHRRERWLKRSNELKLSDKVKLKQLESLAKDSNHVDLQEDPRCKVEGDRLQEQLIHCRAWTERHANIVDINSHKELLQLLDFGRDTLQYNLGDFVELRGFHKDVIEWRETTQNLLNTIPKSSRYNYEFLRKHIELASLLDIADREVDLLTQIVEICAHWKIIARKILSSRELAKLEIASHLKVEDDASEEDVIDEEMPFTFTVELLKDIYQLEFIATPYDHGATCDQLEIEKDKLFDNQRYCICRRGDDGHLFMIECDSCKEWFHGKCVGISDDVESMLQYTCIGCARVMYGYKLMSTEDQEQAVDTSQLRVFTSTKRVNFTVFRQAIFEGLQIPIYLEELQEMKALHTRIEGWKDKVLAISSIRLVEEVIANPEESSEEYIINTKTNQVDLEVPQIDELGGTLMRLYLESESFPVELQDECELLLRAIRLRKWYFEGSNVLNQLTDHKSSSGMNNYAKQQWKKTIKKLMFKFDKLSKEELTSWDLQHLNELSSNLQYAHQVLHSQGPLPIKLPKNVIDLTQEQDEQIQSISSDKEEDEKMESSVEIMIE